MATAAGPASNTAELLLGNVVPLEIQVPNGLPSLSPAFAPNVDYTATVTPINKMVVGVQITNPA